MEKVETKLGYFESISQVLALKVENLEAEHRMIWQLLEHADEEMFYQLSPHLFITWNEEGKLVAEQLEATTEGYNTFKALFREV